MDVPCEGDFLYPETNKVDELMWVVIPNSILIIMFIMCYLHCNLNWF
jgi:hypothetical protein